MARYTFVPERSKVWIDARSNVHPIHSAMEGLEGYVDLDLSGQTVDLSNPPTGHISFSVERLSSGNRMQDRELKKRIDARRFPVIEGELGQVSADGEVGAYRVRGDVIFRGVTRPHEDDLRITPLDERTIRLEGSSSFDIREFGMEPPRVLMLKVEPEVEVRIEVVAVKDASG
jgi:polyisoprenoid-binding protein YceI